jgi:hypothetical protein
MRTHKKRRTEMKRLAVLGVALAALATPALAQSAPQKWDAPVYGFNGNVFDPPAVDKQMMVAPRPQTRVVHRRHRGQQ